PRELLDDERGEDGVGRVEGAALVECIEAEADDEEERELANDEDSAADERAARVGEGWRCEQALDDQVVHAVRRHREEPTADEARPEPLTAGEAAPPALEVEDAELVEWLGRRDDPFPPADEPEQHDERGDPAD